MTSVVGVHICVVWCYCVSSLILKVLFLTLFFFFPIFFSFSFSLLFPSRQLNGIFMDRFKRVMQNMVKEWMHGYYVAAMRLWREHTEDHSREEQEVASVICQKFWRGCLGRKKVKKLRQKILRKKEKKRFKQLMLDRKRWLSAIKIQSLHRGHSVRIGTLLQQAKIKMKAIITIQSHYRIKNSKFLFLILNAKRKLDNIAACKIQRIALGFGGRRRAKLRKKVKVMEEREALLGDRSYVMAQGFRREGAVVMLQRWIRHCQGKYMCCVV